MTTLDHPYIRKSHSCPLCGEDKNTGLLVCWNCFGAHAMRSGNVEIDERLGEVEEELRSACEVEFDDENIYNLPCIRQSIEEDRK